jgi:hypothetical protein
VPLIDVYPDTFRAYNRVEVNWADVPSVEYAAVYRVDAVTGTCTPLRPYICFNGDYLLLSCGHGIFWDTEVPLDRSVYYITEGLNAPCPPAPIAVQDTFTRIVVDGWGNATPTGQAWTNTGGAAGDYDVNGTHGTQTHTAVNVLHNSLLDTGVTTQDLRATLFLDVLATGASITHWLAGGVIDTNNMYVAQLVASTTGTVTLILAKRVATVLTTLSTLAVGTYVAGDIWHARFQVSPAGHLKAKLWSTTTAEPDDWQITVTDTDLSGGTQAGLLSRLETGNTNTLPQVIRFDNFTVTEPCQPCQPITEQTGPTTMPSNGAFRLRDPVRPCNDLYVPLCFDQQADPQCLPGSGIFFGSMSQETHAANSATLLPDNAEFPIVVSRTRRGVESTLTLVTRTFDDRDNLIRIAKPGSLLLLQGPPQYGIPDRYMGVGDLSFDRGLTDHRFPVRIATLPHVQAARAAGPTQGVCGSRVKDICAENPTWGDLAAAGFTWDDLIRGHASPESGPGVPRGRTWNDVNAEFTDWDDVNTGGRTWHDLEVGD